MCVCERERTYQFLTFTGHLIPVSINRRLSHGAGRIAHMPESTEKRVRSQGEGAGGETVYKLRYAVEALYSNSFSFPIVMLTFYSDLHSTYRKLSRTFLSPC